MTYINSEFSPILLIAEIASISSTVKSLPLKAKESLDVATVCFSICSTVTPKRADSYSSISADKPLSPFSIFEIRL